MTTEPHGASSLLPGTATAGGGRLLASDARVALLVTDEVSGRAMTRMLGVPRDRQSLVLKLVLGAAVVTTIADTAARLSVSRALPSRGDVAIGASVLDAGVRGILGAQWGTIPAGGLVIGAVVLAHSMRSALTGSAREMQAAMHGVEGRYGHGQPR